MRRTRVRQRRTAVVLGAALVAGAWAGPLASAVAERGRVTPVERSSYVVRDGDTVWSIARRLSPGQDPRPVVDSILSENAVSPGAIVPGRVLVIPAG